MSKRFGGIKAVQNCSFGLKPGQITALIGPNGSGKTTLFNLISGNIKVDSGKIILFGENATQLSAQKRARLGLSRMFQHSRLFDNMTVKDNLMLATTEHDSPFFRKLSIDSQQEKDMREILESFGLLNKINFQCNELSYGQKRLIEITQKYLYPHKLLLLDEPIAGVNPILRETISNFLVKLKRQGETILLIEHDMNFVFNLADTIIVMDSGKIIAEGNPEEIKNNPEVIKAYLGE